MNEHKKDYIYIVICDPDNDTAGLEKVVGERYQAARNIILQDDNGSERHETLQFDVFITLDKTGKYASVYHTACGIKLFDFKEPFATFAEAQSIAHDILWSLNPVEYLATISQIPRINDKDPSLLEQTRLEFEQRGGKAATIH